VKFIKFNSKVTQGKVDYVKEVRKQFVANIKKFIKNNTDLDSLDSSLLKGLYLDDFQRVSDAIAGGANIYYEIIPNRKLADYVIDNSVSSLMISLFLDVSISDNTEYILAHSEELDLVGINSEMSNPLS
jgi:hypothetical protein